MSHPGSSKRRHRAPLIGATLIVLLAAPFVLYALDFGLRGLTRDLTGTTYLFDTAKPFANTVIFLHMLTGALITFAAPIQILPATRSKRPAIHRITGRILLPLGIVTALCGLTYIVLRGTIGGAPMDAGFALYGVLLLVAAGQALRFARIKDFSRHRRWALRFFVLAIGSWLYRLHYTVWHLATGGLWSTPDFTGAFDYVQMVGFYLPYLLLLEFYLRRAPDPFGPS